MIDGKELDYLFRFFKTRVAALVLANVVAFVFIDYWGWKFWHFTLWFTPVNFMTNYLMSRWAFKRGKKHEGDV